MNGDKPSINPHNGSYYIDTNFNLNLNNPNSANGSNNNDDNIKLNSDFKSGLSLSGGCSQSAPTSINISTSNDIYPRFTPTIDYIQCVSSGDGSITSSESNNTKLSFNSTVAQEQNMLITQGNNNHNYNYIPSDLYITEKKQQGQNDNKEMVNSTIRRGRGRGNTNSNGSSRKRQATNLENSVSSGSSVTQGKGKHGKALARHPFIPSYMDPNTGPHLCVVCKHNASGFHYRVMACEGCKGFFRRTVQNNLKYTCKFNNNCDIQPHNRAQCQECRWKKCLEVGMARDLVLSDEARRAKKELIAANRAKRQAINGNLTLNTTNNKNNQIKHENGQKVRNTKSCGDYDENNDLKINGKKILTEDEVKMVNQIQEAFETTESLYNTEPIPEYSDPVFNQIVQELVDHHITSLMLNQCHTIDPESINNMKYNHSTYFAVLVDVVEPMLRKLVLFARKLPRFNELSIVDQIQLIENTSFDIITLRNYLGYDADAGTLRLASGLRINESGSKACRLLEPTFGFSKRISWLKLNMTEVSLLAAMALVSNDRTGVQNRVAVETVQDCYLTLTANYLRETGRDKYPIHRQAEFYTTVLTELRTAQAWHRQIVRNNLYSLLVGPPTALLAIYRHTHSVINKPTNTYDNNNHDDNTAETKITSTNFLPLYPSTTISNNNTTSCHGDGGGTLILLDNNHSQHYQPPPMIIDQNNYSTNDPYLESTTQNTYYTTTNTITTTPHHHHHPLHHHQESLFSTQQPTSHLIHDPNLFLSTPPPTPTSTPMLSNSFTEMLIPPQPTLLPPIITTAPSTPYQQQYPSPSPNFNAYTTEPPITTQYNQNELIYHDLVTKSEPKLSNGCKQEYQINTNHVTKNSNGVLTNNNGISKNNNSPVSTTNDKNNVISTTNQNGLLSPTSNQNDITSTNSKHANDVVINENGDEVDYNSNIYPVFDLDTDDLIQ